MMYLKNLFSDKYYPVIVFAVVGVIGIMFNIIFGESICLFTQILGIPCPSCGMTRAYLSLFQLDIKGAFWYHPLVPVPILICILSYYRKLSSRIIFIFIGLFIFVWIVRMILLFPNQIEPMIFDGESIVPTVFSRFRVR